MVQNTLWQYQPPLIHMKNNKLIPKKEFNFSILHMCHTTGVSDFVQGQWTHAPPLSPSG